MIIVFDATIKNYLKEIDEADLLTVDQERSLGKRVIEDNDPEARERLVRSNLRLVVNIAKKFGRRGMPLGDLIEEGNLGLIRAVDYYDPDHGTRFSTYAAWWIKQSIKRALLMNTRPVHIPTYMVALINHWRHTAAELESRLGREPSIEEMKDIMQLSSKKAKVIHDIVKVLGTVRDMNNEEDDEDNNLEAILCDNDGEQPEDDLVAEEEKAKVLRLLEKVEPRQATILRLHYGLDGHVPMPLKDIGEKLGLTRERIRQLLRGTLSELYEYMEA